MEFKYYSKSVATPLLNTQYAEPDQHTVSSKYSDDMAETDFASLRCATQLEVSTAEDLAEEKALYEFYQKQQLKRIRKAQALKEIAHDGS